MGNNLKRNFSIFWLLATFSLKSTFEHRTGVVFFLIGKIIRFVIYFLFIYYLVKGTKLLAGYNLNQTIVFFLTFNFIDSLTQLLFREVYRFRQLVVSAEFDSVLLKPYHPFLRILVGGVDILDAILIFPYLFMLIYFINKLPNLSTDQILVYIGLVINAVLIATSFHILVLALAILTTEVDHALMIYRDFTRMVSMPLDIYREPLRSFLLFVIPVGIMMYVPVRALFGLLTIPVFINSMAVSIIFIVFSLWLWNYALRKYQSWGG